MNAKPRHSKVKLAQKLANLKKALKEYTDYSAELAARAAYINEEGLYK